MDGQPPEPEPDLPVAGVGATGLTDAGGPNDPDRPDTDGPAAVGPPGSMMRGALALQRGIDRMAGWFGTVSWIAVLVTLAVGVVNVVLRYLGSLVGRSLTTNGLVEAQYYLYSVIFLLGFAYVLRDQVNVRVDFWFADQPPRRKAWIDLVGHMLFLLPFALLGAWISLEPVRFSWRVGETSSDPGGLPRAPIKTLILVGLVLLAIQAVAEIIRLVAFLRGHGPSPHDRLDAPKAVE